MDKTELRKQVIDFIVVYLHPKGEMIGRSELSGQVKKRFGDGFASDPKWNRFYDSVIADITSPANDVILITDGSLIGLSDLGRTMGDAGGYTAYRSKERISRAASRYLLTAYYLTAIIAALVAAGIIHFSKNHDVAVPSVGFALFWAVTGGLVRDIIPRVSRLTALLFQRKV